MIDTTSNTEMCSVRGHTRSITDLNWSHQDKCLLATASYDNYIHVWDLREPRKAVNTMYSIAGAFQIKWCKEDDNFLSTAHEGDVRIWDRRVNVLLTTSASTKLAFVCRKVTVRYTISPLICLK